MVTPFHRFGFDHSGPRLPVLLSVPHASRAYGSDLLAATRVSRTALAALEDPLVDRLVERGIAAGAAAIVAAAPRALIDLNRSLDDLDPAMVSPPPGGTASRRASAGLGLIPSRLAGQGSIWRHNLPAGEVRRRIDAVHGPYHDALAAALSALHARFGIAVLLDCHSMPSRPSPAPAVVLGDRHGTSCAGWLTRTVEATCGAEGAGVARNEPYAGGEVVRRHGHPAADIHALQIEIDRGMYLAPNARDAGVGFARTARLLERIVVDAADTALGRPMAQAAE